MVRKGFRFLTRGFMLIRPYRGFHKFCWDAWVQTSKLSISSGCRCQGSRVRTLKFGCGFLWCKFGG